MPHGCTSQNVEVHKAGFLSGIAPSLLLKYIISISLQQVASLVGELAVIQRRHPALTSRSDMVYRAVFHIQYWLSAYPTNRPTTVYQLSLNELELFSISNIVLLEHVLDSLLVFVLAFEATVALLLALQMLDVIVRLLYLHRLGVGPRAHRDY